MYPVIDEKKCKKCGTCIEFCPMKVFEKDKEMVVVKKPKECIGCRACEVQCPSKVIQIKE